MCNPLYDIKCLGFLFPQLLLSIFNVDSVSGVIHLTPLEVVVTFVLRLGRFHFLDSSGRLAELPAVESQIARRAAIKGEVEVVLSCNGCRQLAGYILPLAIG